MLIFQGADQQGILRQGMADLGSASSVSKQSSREGYSIGDTRVKKKKKILVTSEKVGAFLF